MKFRLKINHFFVLSVGLILFEPACIRRKKSHKDDPTEQRSQAAEPTAHEKNTFVASQKPTTLQANALHDHRAHDDKVKAEKDFRGIQPINKIEKSEQKQKKHQQTKVPDKPVAIEDRMVKVDFEDEDLATMVNHFAALKKINIVLPQGVDTLNQKITFKLPYEIPLREVDRYLDTFLDLAGYARVLHGPVQRIVRNDAPVSHESLPLYVGVEPQKLPLSDERIRYIYYFKNLRVPDNEQGTEPMTAVLTGMLSGSRSIMYDPKSNSVLLADKANSIRAAVTLLVDLDTIGIREVIRAIPLYNAVADQVAPLIAKQIIASAGAEEQQPSGRDSGRYFSASMKIFPDARTNSLLVMGREPAVERLQDFIREHIDVPADSGRSILHFYNLQYLDAEAFAPVLQKIVTEQAVGSGQATQQGATGAYRFFEGVIVVAEKVVAENITESKAAASKSSIQSILKGSVYRGGNRIIVSALTDDWKRIEKLIAQLDKPRLQVVIQVLIVDLAVTNNQVLASQLRNPSWMQLPKGFAFQSAQLVQPILNGDIAAGSNPPNYLNPTTVAADLLRLLTGGVSAATTVVSTPANIGSTILAFNDPSATLPGIWLFMQWLQSFVATKVIAHPYIVTQNHTRGEEYISTILRLPGPVSTGEGGAQAIKIEDVEAAIKVSVVPRASSIDRLNLQVSVVIQQFESTGAAQGTNRSTRELHTDVNLNSGDMLVLGGLTSYNETDSDSETPLLGQIPLLKWFFSNTQKALVRSNLAIFISPTVVDPKIRAGMDEFTKEEIRKTYALMNQDELLSQFKDPVSVLFFDDQNNDDVTMFDQYLALSKGDFVFDDMGQRPPTPSQHCEPCVDELDDAAAAAELKRTLATEENPLLSVKNTPKQGVLNR